MSSWEQTCWWPLRDYWSVHLTCWWPLSDPWSVHLTCKSLCGVGVWKFIGTICIMRHIDELKRSWYSWIVDRTAFVSRNFGEISKCFHGSIYQIGQYQKLFSFNTLRPRQVGRHFPDDILRWIFLNENSWILINISLKFVPRVPINNIPALVQIMACRRPGDKPLSEPVMDWSPTHICVTRPQWVKRK